MVDLTRIRHASRTLLHLVVASACAGCPGVSGDGPQRDTDSAPQTQGGRASDASTGDEPDSRSDSGGSPSEPSGPRILSFSTNVAQLTEEETVRFSAVLTDPDGVEDLIGGELRSGSTTLATFATSAQEGAYTLALSWDELGQALAFEFDDEQSLEFTGVFFDAAGHETTATTQLRLHCDGLNACSGRCLDRTTSADHCGACGNACAPIAQGEAVCYQGECLKASECFERGELPVHNCTEICAASGMTCVEGAGFRAYCDFDEASPCTNGNCCEEASWCSSSVESCGREGAYFADHMVCACR